MKMIKDKYKTAMTIAFTCSGAVCAVAGVDGWGWFLFFWGNCVAVNKCKLCGSEPRMIDDPNDKWVWCTGAKCGFYDIEVTREVWQGLMGGDVPEGFKLMPVKATNKMVNAANNIGCVTFDDGSRKALWECHVDTQRDYQYAAMVDVFNYFDG